MPAAGMRRPPGRESQYIARAVHDARLFFLRVDTLLLAPPVVWIPARRASEGVSIRPCSRRGLVDTSPTRKPGNVLSPLLALRAGVSLSLTGASCMRW